MSPAGTPHPGATRISAAHRLPRVVIAAPGSGHGKTTVATGLMAALRAEDLVVAGFKIGPDYIDPGYHALATGRPGRNLDPYLCSVEQLAPLLLHGAAAPEPADLAVVEGVMGLFDGRIGTEGYASTAHVAGVLRAPIVLVLDIGHVSRTAAALVHGLHTFEPDTRLSGVILNKAGSLRHSDEVVRALEATGLPVLGVLPRDAGIEAPSRHLGLVPAAERDEAAATVALLGSRVAEHLDLTALLGIAYRAPDLTAEPWAPDRVVQPPQGPESRTERPVIAVAGGRAFTFRYAETEELLVAAGCRPVPFDPLTDRRLPAGTAGLYLGGGFPEVHAAQLQANAVLRTEIAARVRDGLPTVAECAGLLYLCRTVDEVPMVGVVEADAVMSPKLTLSYRTAVAEHDHLLGPAGTRVTGHEFHRTTTTVAPGSPAWLLDGRPDGYASATLHASYLHTHWAGHPGLAQHFADAVHAYARRAPSPAAGTADRTGTDRPVSTVDAAAGTGADGARANEDAERGGEPTGGYDLAHHGDREVGDGLVDLAVNVRVPTPPEWLVRVIEDRTRDLAAYPDPSTAAAAIARAHDLGLDQVLPTAGAAEAFTLIARAVEARHAVIVHPQFTEPEAALRAAGRPVGRVVLRPEDGFSLDPGAVPDDADLVMVGNPTNPTSTLHPAAVLRALLRPNRLLVVDEAFLDAVPGEPETLIGGPMPGLLVLRSLTKTWGLAGLRAGYVVGDPAWIARLAAQQPAWSVSTPALAAITACLTPDARRRAEVAAHEIDSRRALLTEVLAEVELPVAGSPRAPFVLVDTRAWRRDRAPGWVRGALRERGFAVRRGDTFPGLDADWIRIAVRDADTVRALAKTLRALRDGT